jgi:glyoxylase-like metal-dependent hydrolase (beta-lactamase superfamily II)/ferredoxin
MPRVDLSVSENVAGDFYVDSSCIDCDTCRWMAPATFAEGPGHSFVHRQPATAEATRRAEMALLACPTASIGTRVHHDFATARAAFPDPIDGPVYHCGFHAESSYAATSYFIVRPEGNVLVDSPRFTSALVRRIEAMGGIAQIFLTHKDDIADQAKFAAHFGARRIMHAGDIGRSTRDVEIVVEGNDPYRLADDLVVIPTPGHTLGSACLSHRDTYLFTGDHLAWSEELGHLYAFRDYSWMDWSVQIAAMERLATQRFEWVLPGHGRRHHAAAERMRDDMATCVAWMHAVA